MSTATALTVPAPGRQCVTWSREELSLSEVNAPSTIVVAQTKSMGISIILTLLFGPLGMLYSTIPGAIIMGIATLVAILLTAGFGLILTWPICLIWGAVAVKNYNNKLRAGIAVNV